LPGTPIQIDDLSLSEINDALGAPVLQEPKARYFGQASLAYVEDFSFQGLTSPIKGGRYRLAVTPRVGSTSLVTALADLRRYLYANPVTFALQGLHIGNYGARQGDFFADEYIGFPYGRGFVRGYRIGSIDASRECPAGARTPGASCPALERLVGTRIAKVSAEVRVPLLGPERLSLIPFSYLPTELVAFAEGGLAWSRQTNFTLDYDPSALFRIGDRTPVYSAGVAARVNVLGALVGEVYYAYPFQRPEAGWQLGLRLTPGW
jgi:outer membrane protein assembly factor BamA